MCLRCHGYNRITKIFAEVAGKETESMTGQKHVDYVLAAEFHIDSGPMITHQYPEPLSGDVK